MDLDQEAFVKKATRGLAIGESSTTSCGQLITSEPLHSSFSLGRRPTQARQWEHTCFKLLYVYWVCVGQIRNKTLHPSQRRASRQCTQTQTHGERLPSSELMAVPYSLLRCSPPGEIPRPPRALDAKTLEEVTSLLVDKALLPVRPVLSWLGAF